MLLPHDLIVQITYGQRLFVSALLHPTSGSSRGPRLRALISKSTLTQGSRVWAKENDGPSGLLLLRRGRLYHTSVELGD
jgi:hypothetical protein